MLIGYVRTSTDQQQSALQVDALKSAGVSKIFHDVMSGARTDRPGLADALNYAREGDILVVWRLDRLGRSLADLLAIVADLEQRGVELQSLTEAIDTSSAGGQLIFHIFGAIAEFERQLIRDRTRAGLASARARGRCGGRPRKLTADQVQMARRLMLDPSVTVRQVCETMKVSKTTLYNALKRVEA